MTSISGTATDHNDFYDKLISFLTGDSNSTDAQAWDIVWVATGGQRDGVVLKGPGLGGTDSIYISLRLEANTGIDSAIIRLNGMTGVLTSGVSFIDHVNVSPRSAVMFLRTGGAMDYWFTMSGRRFIAAARVSTVYEMMYAGFILPYCLPAQYPYPLLVGACASYGQSQSAPTWKSSLDDHTWFARAFSTVNAGPSGWLIDPAGQWQAITASGGVGQTGVLAGPTSFGSGSFGLDTSAGSTAWQPANIEARIIQALGGDWILRPVTLTQLLPTDQTYGALDGLYHIGGRGNVVENLVTVDDLNYLVLQNTFRVSTMDMLAMQFGEDSNSP